MSEARFIQGPVLFNEAKVKESNDGKFILAGRFGLAEDVNENVRVYTHKLWKNILNRPSVKQMIKDKRMLGQLGHPETVEPDLQNVSHAVTYLELKDDGEIYGEAEVFDTPAGKILKILYNSGVRLGISSRGYIPDDVDYTEGVGQEVPDEYELVGFDFVIDPSTHGAFPTLKESTKRQLNQIVLESKGKLGKSLCESINRMVNGSTKKLQFSLEGVSNVKRKQIRGLMEGRYPEANVVINEGNLNISNLPSDKQISATSYFNKLVNENSFIKKINAKSSENDKEENQMAKEIVSAEKITEGNYELAKQVIAELLNDKSIATGVIEDLVKRYKISESKLNTLSRKLKDAEGNTDTLDAAEEIIAELRDRYLLAEDVIKDLVARYNAQSRQLGRLQKKYKVAESVASKAAVSNKVKPACDEETSEEVIAELVRRLKSSEEVIAELRDRYLLSEEIIKDLKSRYTLSEEVISEMAGTIKLSESVISDLRDRYLLSEDVIKEFKEAYSSKQNAAQKASAKVAPAKKVSKKPVAESKVTNSKKATPVKNARDYSEYPYTKKGTTKKVMSESAKTTTKTETTRTKRDSYEAKLASIVASVQ